MYTKKFIKFPEVHSPNLLKTMLEIAISGNLGGSIFKMFSTPSNYGGTARGRGRMEKEERKGGLKAAIPYQF